MDSSISLNVGLPIFFLILTIFSFIWFGIAFGKKYISNSITITWLTINILFSILFIYLLIIGIVNVSTNNFSYESFNFLEWFSNHVLGISFTGSWSIIVLLIIFIIGLCVLINTLIKLNLQNRKINDLNRNLAILKGKVAIDMNELSFDTSELSAEELRYLLEEQLSKEKLKAKYKNKLAKVSKKQTFSSSLVDTKTLLNINSKDNKKSNNEDENKIL